MPEGRGNQRSEKGPVGRDSGTNARGNEGRGSGGTVGDKSKGTGFGGLLDKVFGYENLGQRRAAYSNNPNAAGKSYDGMIPSFPEAPFAYGLAALAGAPLGPVGWAGKIADIAMGGSGHGMLADAMAAQGMGPGPRGPDVPGGGQERGGQGMALNGGALNPTGMNSQGFLGGVKNPAQSPGLLSQVPVGTSAPQPQTPPAGLLTMEYPGQTVPIGGPTPYNYYRPSYNYYGR